MLVFWRTILPERPTLVIMVKDPRAGRVKTRLGREIGMVDAAWWYRHQTRSLIRRLRDPRWRIVLAVSPDRAMHEGRFWPAQLARVAQGNGDLGARMARVMRSVARGPVCLIGSDVPGVAPHNIARAFAHLGRNDAVLGPAVDGGFWLIGLRIGGLAHENMFGKTRWSHNNTLTDTLRFLPFERIALADTLADVDAASDLTGPGL